MLSLDLHGKVALVTGASGELGRCLVRTLAECGADMAIHYYQNTAKATELVEQVHSMGRQAVAVQADVCSEPEVFAMQRDIRERLGESPHIVVANAVIQIHPWSTILEEDIESFESQYKSCVLQNVLLSKAFMPAMIERNSGRYIGISTECVMQCKPKSSAYVSGKRGMDAVLRVLAREVGEHQITVNQIAPGYTISDKQRSQGVRTEDTQTPEIPLNRRGTDQELANVVAFIASDLASYITGAFIPCSGGSVMPAI